MNDNIWFNADSATVMAAAMADLTRQGLYVLRSFDLRSALAADGPCACPHHGSAHCNCQFLVLLIYGDFAQPVVLTLHGRDAQTQVQIVRDATTVPDPRLAEKVMAALVETGLAVRAALPLMPDAH